MYIGHFALAFAAKPSTPKVPLPVLMVAACWADLLWLALFALGIERAEMRPGITVVSPIDLIHYPYSHGLAATLFWAALLGGGWALLRRDKRGAWMIGALVFIHWALDFLTHRPDLPLLLGEPKVGLGLWNHRAASLLVEGGTFLLCMAWYLRRTRAHTWWAHLAFWTFMLYCIATYLPDALGMIPPPPHARVLLVILPASLVLLLLVYAIDRGRPVIE